jgi:hypothetical protein
MTVATMSSHRVFAGLLIAATLFLLASSALLPPMVASHFVSGGAANAFMPRSGYVAFMLVLTIGLPSLLVASHVLLRRLPATRINLPNRDYWLAPERREATLAYLSSRGAQFGSLLLVFLCIVQALVIEANATQPPRLPELALLAVLAVFVLVTLGWIATLVTHFRVRA